MSTQTLIRAAQAGDRSAAEQLVVENSGLIWSIARRYFGRGTEPDDLYQLGCVGFLKAVAGFDLSYGTQFSTYAVPKIAGEIRRFLRDDGQVKGAMAETATGMAESIQRESGDEGFSLEDVLCTDGMEDRILESLSLRNALSHLTERERMVIDLRYFHGLTQQKIAGLLGVSQVQVSRIEKKALTNLRTYL